MKLRDYENASKALHISLKSTNACLIQIGHELKQGQNKKNVRQILYNLEAELVLVSIEAFYLLNVIYQASGDKEKALACLDRIEEYMNEQHARDLELHSNVMTTLRCGEDFIFAEGSTASAIEGKCLQQPSFYSSGECTQNNLLAGPKNHFEKDKADIHKRVQTALQESKSRHTAERATLTFSRIMAFHKTLPHPSQEEESLIDKKIRDLVKLSLEVTNASRSDHSSAQNRLTPIGSKAKGHNEVFNLALHAIRVRMLTMLYVLRTTHKPLTHFTCQLVHVRRIISNASFTSHTDNYKFLLENLPKSHFQRPFVMIDQLNSMLALGFQVRERKFDANFIKQLDSEALAIAKVLSQTVEEFLDKSAPRVDTTLFAASTHEPQMHELFEQAKIHFARAVSLYHVSDSHENCAQWSDLLESIIRIELKESMSLNDSGILLGQVMTVKAYALSMSGNLGLGLKTARDAWEKTKTIDSMVTLFHCSLRQEVENHSGDTKLEFDAALNELLSLASGSTIDDVIAAFPRLSNSCAENEGSDLILLGVQERWIDLILSSTAFQRLNEWESCDSPAFTLFGIFRAYLHNFESFFISSMKGCHPTVANFEALERIIDGILKLLVQLRETRPQKKSGRRKKRKTLSNTDGTELDGVLVWDDHATKKMVGNRSDCVWIVEQLWNIGNQLMSASFGASGIGDLRGFAANVFAASHDFCLMSDEEMGQSLSKNHLDYDVKFDPTKSVLPSFGMANDRHSCDISSEASQMFLVSFTSSIMSASIALTLCFVSLHSSPLNAC